MVLFPPFSWVVIIFENDKYFRILEYIHMIVSFACFLFLPIDQLFPSGMFLTNAKARRRACSINPRIAIFCMHFPALLFFAIFLHTFSVKPKNFLPEFAVFVYLIYRCFVYPWFRQPYANKYPLRTVFFQSCQSLNFTLFFLRMHIFTPREIDSLAQVFIINLVFICFICLIYCDWIVCRSRKPAPNYYVVNHQFFFKTVTCPQYTFQCLMYILLSIFYRDFKGFIATGIWLVILFMKRADNVRLCMSMMFRGYNRQVRYPIFPFLTRTPGIL